MAVAVAYAVGKERSDLVYQIPIAVQFVPTVLTLCLLPVMPESPRWLLTKDRVAHARHALLLLGRGREGYDVDFELNKLQQDIEGVKFLPKTAWNDLFRGVNLKRTLISMGAICLKQAQGLGFIASYSNLLLARLSPKYNEIFLAGEKDRTLVKVPTNHQYSGVWCC